MIDAGIELPGVSGTYKIAIQPDFTDVDQNSNRLETIPWDYQKVARVVTFSTIAVNDPADPNSSGVVSSHVDMGAYEACPGDVNGDGVTNLTDVALVLTYFGLSGCMSGTACFIGDLNGDEGVDLTDLAYVLADYGLDCHASVSGFSGSGEGALLAAPTSPLDAWLRSATPQEVLDWWNAGMPPIGGGEDR